MNANPTPPITLVVDPSALAPFVRAIVAETLDQVKADNASLPDGQEWFTEREAADYLRLNWWQVRDERLEGRLSASQTRGRRIRYSSSDLQQYMAARRVQPKS